MLLFEPDSNTEAIFPVFQSSGMIPVWNVRLIRCASCSARQGAVSFRKFSFEACVEVCRRRLSSQFWVKRCCRFWRSFVHLSPDEVLFLESLLISLLKGDVCKKCTKPVCNRIGVMRQLAVNVKQAFDKLFLSFDRKYRLQVLPKSFWLIGTFIHLVLEELVLCLFDKVIEFVALAVKGFVVWFRFEFSKLSHKRVSFIHLFFDIVCDPRRYFSFDLLL